MDSSTVPATYFENLKRYLRRRRYQRLDDDHTSHNKKKLRITRLGSGSKTRRRRRRVWKIRLVPKLRFKVVSPMKLLAKFHEAYVNTMIRLLGDSDVDLFGGKRIPKGRSVPMVSTSDEIVDGRLVLEIYKRLMSSHELRDLLV